MYIENRSPNSGNPVEKVKKGGMYNTKEGKKPQEKEGKK